MNTSPARRRRRHPLAAAAFAAGAAAVAATAPASATWSIVMTDSSTREVAVGTVTCLNDFDLLAIVPVVVVGEGAGACQASGDFNGTRRPIINFGLRFDQSPAQILDSLSGVSGHQSRQYGIVDTEGQAITFTGSQTLDWAGGLTGGDGTVTWAIQGNILAGDCVVPAIEAAILATDGDLAERLMAGMEAAAGTGGDGRCSCDALPTSCGCPIPGDVKSGHIGGMVVARVGDVDDPACTAAGCADGDYFMRLNVAFQGPEAPDPVDQLRVQFDAWRAGLAGRVDALTTETTTITPAVPANGTSGARLVVGPRTAGGRPPAVPATAIAVTHADGSAALATIGPPAGPDANGAWTVELVAGAAIGLDAFRVVVTDAAGDTFEVMPRPTLDHLRPGDLDGDGTVDFVDLVDLLAVWGPCGDPPATCLGDLDGDGGVGFADLVALLAAFDG